MVSSPRETDLHSSSICSRSLSICLLLGLFPIGNSYSAPQIDSAKESRHRLEYRSSIARDVRSVTDQPGIDSLLRPTPVINDYPPRDDGRGSLRWTASDQNGISEQVAVSENGNIVAIGYSLNDERLEVRNAFGGDTLFTFRVESGGSYVSLSATGEIIAYAAIDSVWLFRSNGRGVPFFRFGLNGYYPGPLALSPAGDRLVATGSDPEGAINRAWGFNTANGQRLWTLEVNAQEVFGWYGARISADGRIAVVNGKFRLFVVDAANGELIWEEPTYNTESPVEISGDGQILATGSLSGRLRLFGRVGQSYDELWHYTFRGAVSSWISSVSLSRDGRTVAAGTLDFFNNRYEGRFALFDTYGRGEPIWTSDPFADEIAGLDLSNDGSIVAAVSWGDIDHQQPDLVVHERHSREPFYALTTGGSLAGVRVSGRGNRVIAGGKGTHNRVFGRGGQAHLIELTLLGGFASGRVTNQQNQGIQEVTIGAVGSPYTTLTNVQGQYELRIETPAQRNFTIVAAKRGVGRMQRDAVIRPYATTNGVNFSFRDGLVGDPPANLRASQGTRNQIELTWEPYNGRRIIPEARQEGEFLSATGDRRQIPGLTPWDDQAAESESPVRDNADDALEIHIYRSPAAGGPYSLVGSVDGDRNTFIDRAVVFPQHRYYYRIAATFENGESEYSAEAVGWLDVEFLIWDADLQPFQQIPQIDGEIHAEEWEGAVFRDISDVFGYDAPDTAGSVTAWIAFSDRDDRLYLAVRYRNLDDLQENMGLGVYIDDDGDGTWSSRRAGSEGNYWGYWRNGNPDMRYRSLTGAPWSVDPYYRFQNPTLAFGEGRTGVEVEMSIPLGFHSNEEVAVFAPDQTIGLALFAMHRDEDASPIFDGWWPQNMFSIVTEPGQFARVHIPVTLTVPPLAPSRLEVERDRNGLLLTWRDPEIGVDSAAIRDWDGVNIYRNGEYLTSGEPGHERYFDREFNLRGDWGGWFEYSLFSYVLEDQGHFEGPGTATVGAYLGVEPEVVEMRHDDGSAEAFYVVSFNGEDNRFATKFTIDPGPEEVSAFWIDFSHRGNQPIDVWCAADDNGAPAEGGTHYQVTPTMTEGMERFHFPGREQPRWELSPDLGGSFWVILNYLPTSPGAPAIGVDGSSIDNERNLYYTAATGWVPFSFGQPMIRVGVGQPVNAAPEDGAPLPTRFEVLANYPNPFNGRTFLPVRLPVASTVYLTLIDLQGRVVLQTASGKMSVGEHILTIDAAYLSSGIYIATIDAGGEKRRLTVHLLK